MLMVGRYGLREVVGRRVEVKSVKGSWRLCNETFENGRSRSGV
jgi:hypothetical protein